MWDWGTEPSDLHIVSALKSDVIRLSYTRIYNCLHSLTTDSELDYSSFDVTLISYDSYSQIIRM
jgi:hypothetical protein